MEKEYGHTYYGGEQIEEIYAVEIDDEDNIYIGGQTASNNNMTTSGSFESQVIIFI